MIEPVNERLTLNRCRIDGQNRIWVGDKEAGTSHGAGVVFAEFFMLRELVSPDGDLARCVCLRLPDQRHQFPEMLRMIMKLGSMKGSLCMVETKAEAELYFKDAAWMRELVNFLGYFPEDGGIERDILSANFNIGPGDYELAKPVFAPKWKVSDAE